MREDEIRLLDILRLLARRKTWLFGTIAIVVACAAILVFLVRPEWEATAIIRVGQIGQAGVNSPPTMMIEPLATAIERLRMTPFQNEVLGSVEIAADAPAARLYRRSITIQQVPGAELIRVKVRGYGAEQARQLAQATTDHLRDMHRTSEEPALAVLRSQLDQLKNDLRNALRQQDELLQAIHPDSGSEAENTAARSALVMNIAASSRDPEIRDLRQQTFLLNERLDPTHTFPTGLLGDIFIPEKAAYPDKILTLSVALVIGLILGCLIAMTKDYVSRTYPDFLRRS